MECLCPNMAFIIRNKYSKINSATIRQRDIIEAAVVTGKSKYHAVLSGV